MAVSARQRQKATLDDHIGRSELEKDMFQQRLEWPLQVLAENGLEFAFKYKQKVFLRLNDYIQTARNTGEEGRVDEDVLLKLLLDDYEAFCAFFYNVPITNPKTKEVRDGAMYPSPAQAKLVELIETYSTVIALFSRQAGKTSTLSTYTPYHALKYPGSRVNLLAPTQDQLEVMTTVFHFINKIEYIKDNYVGTGELNKTKIKFMDGGSVIKSKNIGPNTGGDYRRGMSGTCFIDEWTLVSEDTIKKVLQPLQANMYSAVKLIYTGTPITDYNPNAEDMWNRALESDDIGTIHVSCWENIELGATSRKLIAKRFQEEGIPCDHGKKGYCPRFYRRGGSFYPPQEEWADFKCNQVCYEYDDVVMEYFAEFPSGSSRVFPKQWMLNTIDPNLALLKEGEISPPGTHRVMSIDLGFASDPTVILIADPTFNTKSGRECLNVIGWYEIKAEKDQKLGTDPLRDRIQELYYLFKPSVIYIDATRNEVFVENLYKTGNRIPRKRFYANETMEKRNLVGVYWHGHGKHEMVRNHRTQIQAGAWTVPMHPSEFANRWVMDHTHVIAQDVEDGRYKKYPNTGHTFDAAIMASLFLDGKGKNSKINVGRVYF